VAGSLSFSQTVCGGTASSYSPLMVIAIALLLALARSIGLSAYRLARRLKRVLGEPETREGLNA
jgi:hypothetical protein